MSADVVTLPTEPAVVRAWEAYFRLAQQETDNHTLRLRVEHQMAVARAWRDWRALFLAWDAHQRKLGQEDVI